MKATLIEFHVLPFDPMTLALLPPGVHHLQLGFYADKEAVERIARFFKENGFDMQGRGNPDDVAPSALPEPAKALQEGTP